MSPHSAWASLGLVLTEEPLLQRLFFASLELCVLAGVVAAVVWLGRVRSPRVTALLWLAVLVKPVVSLTVGSPLPIVLLRGSDRQLPAVASVAPAAPATAQAVTAAASESVAVPPAPPPSALSRARFARPAEAEQTPLAGAPQGRGLPWPLALTAAWMAGVGLVLGRHLFDRIRLWRIVRAASPPSSRLASCYRKIAGQLGVRRPPRLLLTDRLESPALAGFLWPVIFVPSWLAAEENLRGLLWSLRHELSHWKWLDPVALAVRDAARILFYFHPVVWWAGRRLVVALELACDREIVRDPVEADHYARELFRILERMRHHRRLAVASGLFATRTLVGQRITALVDRSLPLAPRLTLRSAVGVATLALAAVSVGAGIGRAKGAAALEPKAGVEASLLARYAVPPGGVPELLAFLQRVADIRPASPEEDLVHRRALRPALQQAAEAILRQDKDSVSKARGVAKRILLSNRVDAIARQTPEEKGRTLADVTAFLEERMAAGQAADAAALAEQIGGILAIHDPLGIAGDAWKTFAQVVANSRDPRCAEAAARMATEARKLEALRAIYVPQMTLPSPPSGRVAFIDLRLGSNVEVDRMVESAEYPANGLVELPRGEQTFAGVPFKIGDRMIQLAGKGWQGTPAEVEGIAVGRKFVRFYVLHAAQTGPPNSVRDGTPIGQYRFHYEDGTTATMPIVYGEDLRDWWRKEGLGAVTRGQVVWMGSNWCASRDKCLLRLYLGAWENPHPDKKIASLDYISTAETVAAPFCVAMSVEEPAMPGQVTDEPAFPRRRVGDALLPPGLRWPDGATPDRHLRRSGLSALLRGRGLAFRSHALQEYPAAGLVVSLGDLAGTHPDYTVAQMLADPLDHRREGPPADALRGIEPLPVGVPDAIRRAGLDVAHDDAGLPVRGDVVVRVHALRAVLPDAEAVHGVGDQVVDGIFPLARLAVNAETRFTGAKEARDRSAAELALPGEIQKGLPDRGVRLRMALGPQLAVPAFARVAAAAGPGKPGEAHSDPLALGEDSCEVALVRLDADSRLVQPQTLVGGGAGLSPGL